MIRYFISPSKDEISYYTAVTIKDDTISIYHQHPLSFLKVLIDCIPFISEKVRKTYTSHHDLMIEKLIDGYTHCSRELKSEKEFIPNSRPLDHKKLHTDKAEKRVGHLHYESLGTVTPNELMKFFRILKECESTQDLPPGVVFFNSETAEDIVEEYKKFRKSFHSDRVYSTSNYVSYLDSSFPSIVDHTNCLPIVKNGQCSVPYANTVDHRTIIFVGGACLLLCWAKMIQRIRAISQQLAPKQRPTQTPVYNQHHRLLAPKPLRNKKNQTSTAFTRR